MSTSPRVLRPLLSESSRKRLKSVDRSNAIWRAVDYYLKPLAKEVPYGEELETPWWQLETTAWDLYMLILAARNQAEAPIDIPQVLWRLNALSDCDGLSSESKARLATIKGLFAAFDQLAKIPAFRCRAGLELALIERLDEILNDAYLLDASRLRRFFGVGANIRSIKRDLNKLLRFISRNRTWAKGIFSASTLTARLPKAAADAAEKLCEAFPSLVGERASAPVLIEPVAYLNSFISPNCEIAFARRLPFYSAN